jgi:small-conductance mechanosensitive channel
MWESVNMSSSALNLLLASAEIVLTNPLTGGKIRLPSWMYDTSYGGAEPWQWLGLGFLICAAFILGHVLQWLLVNLGGKLATKTETQWDDRFFETVRGPIRYMLALILLEMSNYLLLLEEPLQGILSITLRTLLILVGTWLALRLLGFSSAFLEFHLTRRMTDISRRRAIHTQIAVPQGILRFLVGVLGGALILYQFEEVRTLGVSLLASAGLAGLVVGLAAQQTIANLLAGIQLAVFQPISIEDAVVVEGEWGWIEQIGLTHVVVRIWDLRRLVLPVSYFLNHPFQNWSKTSEDLLGTVYLYTDYTVPLADLREEFVKVLQSTPLWDRKVQVVQVTEMTSRYVELRLLMSSPDGPKMWDLRCLVRERMLDWLQSRGCMHVPIERWLDIKEGGKVRHAALEAEEMATHTRQRLSVGGPVTNAQVFGEGGATGEAGSAGDGGPTGEGGGGGPTGEGGA